MKAQTWICVECKRKDMPDFHWGTERAFSVDHHGRELATELAQEHKADGEKMWKDIEYRIIEKVW